MEYKFLWYSNYKCAHHEDERKRVIWILKFTYDYSSICSCSLLGCSFGITNKKLKKVKNFGRKLLNTFSSGHNPPQIEGQSAMYLAPTVTNFQLHYSTLGGRSVFLITLEFCKLVIQMLMQHDVHFVSRFANVQTAVSSRIHSITHHILMHSKSFEVCSLLGDSCFKTLELKNW